MSLATRDKGSAMNVTPLSRNRNLCVTLAGVERPFDPVDHDAILGVRGGRSPSENEKGGKKGEKDVKDFPGFIRTLPELDLPFSGASGHLLQGSNQQVAFARFDEDVEVPEHSHRAQWELVIAGEVALTIEGVETVYRTGESFYIPEGVPHAGRVRAGYRAIIFFDQADRYRSKEKE